MQLPHQRAAALHMSDLKDQIQVLQVKLAVTSVANEQEVDRKKAEDF